MKFCEKCRVYVPSTREHCPLCQGRLTQAQDNGQPHYDDEICPYLPTIYHQHNLLIRVALFVSVAACVLCLALNFLLTPHNWWSLFVLAGVGAGWLTVAQAIRKRSSFCKHVLYQVVTLALLAVIFDLMTGFLRWSFDYVIPALCAFAMIVIGITSIIRRQHITDYIIYMVLSSVFGIVPLLFLLPGWTTVTWPTVLTAAAGIIHFAALLLFVGRDTWRELRRRLHREEPIVMKNYLRTLPAPRLCELCCALWPIHQLQNGCPGCGGGAGNQSCSII